LKYFISSYNLVLLAQLPEELFDSREVRGAWLARIEPRLQPAQLLAQLANLLLQQRLRLLELGRHRSRLVQLLREQLVERLLGLLPLTPELEGSPLLLREHLVLQRRLRLLGRLAHGGRLLGRACERLAQRRRLVAPRLEQRDEPADLGACRLELGRARLLRRVQLVRRACHRIVQGARVLRDELRLAAVELLRCRLLELRLLLRLRLGCLHLEQLPLGGTLGTRLLDRELRRAPLALVRGPADRAAVERLRCLCLERRLAAPASLRHCVVRMSATVAAKCFAEALESHNFLALKAADCPLDPHRSQDHDVHEVCHAVALYVLNLPSRRLRA